MPGPTQLTFDAIEQQSRTKRHHALVDVGATSHQKIAWNRQVLPNEQYKLWIQRMYRDKIGVSINELRFIASLAHLEVHGKVEWESTRKHWITEGHRWAVQFFNPNIELLKTAGLLKPPYIDGEPRQRIVRRTYWDLTPSSRDLINIDYSGENVGDIGEHVVHRLGVHLWTWWYAEKHKKKFVDDWGGEYGELETERYPLIDGIELDAAAFLVDTSAKKPIAICEVETGLSDFKSAGGTEDDLIKMSWLSSGSWWVFPTREVLVKVINEARLYGYVDLSRELPDTLAVREGRDNCDLRTLQSPKPTALKYKSVERVATYEQMVNDLKDLRPELFYGPKDR